MDTERAALPSLTVRTWPLDEAPDLVQHLPPNGGTAWIRDHEGIVGHGEVARVDPGTGPERFAVAETAIADLAARAEIADEVDVPGSGLVAFASFTFDPGAPGSVLVVPEVVVGSAGGRGFVTRISADPDVVRPELRPERVSSEPVDRPRYAGASLPDVQWLDAVAAAIEAIEAGRLEKVVLARDHAVWARVPFRSKRLVARLADRFPSCFTFVVDDLVGATPELLVRRHGTRVASLALAGSAARGEDPAGDERIGEALLASDKDRREHALAAATVHDALAPRCRELVRDREPQLLRLDNVMHLGTRFDGELIDPPPGVLSLASALHPTAAVGGVPTDAALAMIVELERMPRNRYAGPVGWVGADGDGELGIALRCAELTGARARLLAGAGIVRGSLPEAELEETRLKLLAMQSALAP